MLPRQGTISQLVVHFRISVARGPIIKFSQPLRYHPCRVGRVGAGPRGTRRSPSGEISCTFRLPSNHTLAWAGNCSFICNSGLNRGRVRRSRKLDPV